MRRRCTIQLAHEVAYRQEQRVLPVQERTTKTGLLHDDCCTRLHIRTSTTLRRLSSKTVQVNPNAQAHPLRGRQVVFGVFLVHERSFCSSKPYSWHVAGGSVVRPASTTHLEACQASSGRRGGWKTDMAVRRGSQT